MVADIDLEARLRYYRDKVEFALEELVSDMIENDLKLAKKESLLIKEGFTDPIPKE